MSYHFEKLNHQHLPLLLKWLNSPHVQEFWDTGTTWTSDLVEEKYGHYVDGYKPVDGKKLPMDAYIIHHDDRPIGYIQAYDVAHYERDGYDLTNILKETAYCKMHLAAIDLYLADARDAGRGMGSALMQQFLNDYIWNDFDGCLVDPDSNNYRAIRAYEKAGFIKITETHDRKVCIMVSQKKQ